MSLLFAFCRLFGVHVSRDFRVMYIALGGIFSELLNV